MHPSRRACVSDRDSNILSLALFIACHRRTAHRTRSLDDFWDWNCQEFLEIRLIQKSPLASLSICYTAALETFPFGALIVTLQTTYSLPSTFLHFVIMSSSSPRAAQLPPAQIPLEQLPSASIAQLPPSIHVPPAVAYTATTTTTTTTTIPQQQQQQQHQLPLLASAKRGSDEMQTAQNTQAPPLQLSEKKLRRLEKNRLSARECRRRKREATEDMESEIYTLEGENVRLRLQLRVSNKNYILYYVYMLCRICVSFFTERDEIHLTHSPSPLSLSSP